MTRHKQMLIEIDVDPKDCGKCGEYCAHLEYCCGIPCTCHLFYGHCSGFRVTECLREFGGEVEE